MNNKNIVYRGKKIEEAEKALILLHGRGADAEDILSITSFLQLENFAIVAPEAKGNSWYPYSFLVPTSQNEPWLSSGITIIADLVDHLISKGIDKKNIYFAGFSQGACLSLEFIARNAGKWGGAAAFTGGLIGDKINKEKYTGDFQKTPIFIGTSNPDPHVPVERVHETVEILRNLHATVTLEIYPKMGHTISQHELAKANELIFDSAL